MLEKPDLPDDQIITCLQQAYGLQNIALEFLTLGNDSSAAVYKVSTENATYFLKIKHGVIPLVTVEVPHYLAESGIPQIVSPILNHHHMLWTPLQESMLMLYPFIDGRTGMETGLSSEQWQELGTILKKLHSVELPPQVAVFVPRETFIPPHKWLVIIEALHHQLPEVTFDLVVHRQLATFWSEHREEIARIVSRTQELGRQLQARALPFVLCHADIHTANVLVDREGQLFIVDWDQTIFAPKERDLMFIVGNRDTAMIQDQSEQAFLDGYGHPDINALAVAYYRYEWVVQEIADFAERVFYRPELGTATKQDALRGFKQLFLPGDVVASAYASESYIS
jgi:spectinomycin phosphotransferase